MIAKATPRVRLESRWGLNPRRRDVAAVIVKETVEESEKKKSQPF